jgi:hypothetical protein
MKLLKVRLQGIRRFEAPQTLLVTDPMVAIVGPNEAGKTSLLRALAAIGGEDPLPGGFRTRHSQAPAKMEALFEVEPIDRAAESVLAEYDVRQAWIVKTVRDVSVEVVPEILRQKDGRTALAPVLASLLEADGFLRQLRESEPDPGNEEPVHGYPWRRLLEIADQVSDSQEEWLEAEEINGLGQLGSGIDDLARLGDPEAYKPSEDDERGWEELPPETQRRIVELHRLRTHAAAAVHALAHAEAQPHPSEVLAQAVLALLPETLLFTEEHRALLDEYDLQEVMNGEGPSAALANLADLCGVDLSALLTSMTSDPGTLFRIKEGANARLTEEFRASWAQSDAVLQLDTSGTVLRLMVSAEDRSDFIPLSDRSDGLKWFIALRCFLASQSAERPILLMDEIETHLHYAAQADLVGVLARQGIAPQVIYTTHSVGALPPDLGTGLRAVVPVEGQHRSVIDNDFWTAGPGYTPLLFGMGASTLAFSIPTFVVIAEGASEAIILPSMLREALDVASLPYRIAPGLSNASTADLELLDEQGSRVVFLVDADEGGDNLSKRLADAGIPVGRILSVRSPESIFRTPEDLINRDLYLEAVRTELAGFDVHLQSLDAIPDGGRAKAVEDLCRNQKVHAPSKPRVVGRVLTMARDSTNENARRILGEGAASALQDLDAEIRAALKIRKPKRSR